MPVLPDLKVMAKNPQAGLEEIRRSLQATIMELTGRLPAGIKSPPQLPPLIEFFKGAGELPTTEAGHSPESTPGIPQRGDL